MKTLATFASTDSDRYVVITGEVSETGLHLKPGAKQVYTTLEAARLRASIPIFPSTVVLILNLKTNCLEPLS